MINILLADDDILTLNQLNLLISAMNQYKISGLVPDGLAAISFLKESREPVHILILDVEMPEMSGLEVADYVKRQKLPAMILVLSNYDNFEYVKPLLRLGAWDYILKHELTQQLLGEKLDEMSKLLDAKKLYDKQEKFAENLTRQDFLHKLVLHQPIPESQLNFNLCSKDFEGTRHVLLLMQITNYLAFYQNNREKRQEKIINTVLNLSGTILSTLEGGIITHISFGEFLIYLNFYSEVSTSNLHQKTQQYIASLKSNLSRYLNINTIFESVLMCDQIQNLRAYYLKAHHSLQHKPFCMQDENTATGCYLLTIQEEKELLEAVINLNAQGAASIIHQIFKSLKLKTVSLEQMHGLVNRMMEIITHLIQEYPGLSETVRAASHIPNLLDIDRMEAFLVEYYDTCISRINKTSIHDYPPLVQAALLYIHQNYNQDMSLYSAANHCKITVVYLSKIFKQNLGIPFSKYLSNYRIRMASYYLLRTKYSLREIAQKCGFQNYNYFLTVFKNTTGVTPMQYRTDHKFCPGVI